MFLSFQRRAVAPADAPSNMTDRMAQLERLHQADPKDPFCTYGIALEHAKAERHEQALAWLDKTLALDPHYCYAFYQKAKVLSELGRAHDARAILATGLTAALAARDTHAHGEMTTLLATLE
jgi:tetratricopeptide (TPR) repeat protein